MLNMILPVGSLALIALIFFIAYTSRNQYLKERHLKKAYKRYKKNQRLVQQQD